MSQDREYNYRVRSDAFLGTGNGAVEIQNIIFDLVAGCAYSEDKEGGKIKFSGNFSNEFEMPLNTKSAEVLRALKAKADELGLPNPDAPSEKEALYFEALKKCAAAFFSEASELNAPVSASCRHDPYFVYTSEEARFKGIGASR